MAHRPQANMATAFQRTRHLGIAGLFDRTLTRHRTTVFYQLYQQLSEQPQRISEVHCPVQHHGPADAVSTNEELVSLLQHFNCDADSPLGRRLSVVDCLQDFSSRSSSADKATAGAVIELALARQGLFAIDGQSDDDVLCLLKSFLPCS
jgi:hypothetical protein